MKRTPLIATLLLSAGALALGLFIRSAATTIPRLFRRNAELKAQGYYMGEFEFKMLAAQYHLNQGHYLEAGRTLRRIEAEMKDPRGLAKLPRQADPAARMEFLAGRQSPETGAFMDPAYPLFTCFAPTANAVNQLRELSLQTGRPVKLQHPLHFLDRIERPEQLRAYLDSLLYLRPWCARMPGPGPYGPGASELAYFDELEDAGVHRFPDAWKETLRQWFQETQDPATGFWGARIGTPDRWQQKPDINSTYHILHLVLDTRGENRDPAHPLRHAGNLARSILAQIGTPLPGDAAGQHDWGLRQAQGAGALARLLWPHLSDGEREEVRRAFRRLLAESCRLYRPEAGGFAYYTSDARADVDGTGLALSVFRAAGALPGTWERERLWGPLLAQPPAPQVLEVQRWEEAVLPLDARVRSIRIHAGRLPAGDILGDASLIHIAYPAPAPACDVLDLRQGLSRLLASQEPAFGNWTSKESLRRFPLGLERPVLPVPATRGAIDWAALGRQHPAVKTFYAVGVDEVQIPVQVIRVVRRGA